MNKDKSKNIEVIRSINIEPKPKKILAEIYSRVVGFFVDKILKEKTRRKICAKFLARS